MTTTLSNHLLAPGKDSGIPDSWSNLVSAKWDDLKSIDYSGLGVGATGVGLSSLFSELGKGFVLNTHVNSLVARGALQGGSAQVAKVLASNNAVKTVFLSSLAGAAKLNRPQTMGLFLLGATLFHGAHRLWSYKVDGVGYQGLAPEVESYLYTLGMFAATGLAGKGAGMALTKAAPWVKTVGALGAEYAAFTLWEGLEGVGRLVTTPLTTQGLNFHAFNVVKNNLTAENIGHTLTHPFTFKASMERGLFMGALKAAHPVSSGVQRVVDGKNWSAQGAQRAYDRFGEWQQTNPAQARVAIGTVLGLGGTILFGPAGVSVAAMPLMFGTVVGPEGGAAPRSTKPGAFLRENAVDTYKETHAPEFLQGDPREMADAVIDMLGGAMEAFLRESGIDDPRKVVTVASDGTKDFTLLREVFRHLGEVGFFSMELPEATSADYLPEGGVAAGLNQKTMARVYEINAARDKANRSIGDSLGCNAGIGMVPILLFGNKAQKVRWLPRILSGQWLSAFALTEPNSGSDAPFGNRTTAMLRGDHYVINGSKQFITNGGPADVYIVFATVDGKPSAFVVERRTSDGDPTPGLIVGKEEHKLGLDGSSTVPLTFEDMRVPVENILGMPGMGAQVALGTLAIGRNKLAAALVGEAIRCVNWASKYATSRTQGKGGVIIKDYGQVQRLLADSAIAVFAAQSLSHRLAGEADARAEAIKTTPTAEQSGAMDAAESFFSTPRELIAKVLAGQEMAASTSMAKLTVSEMLNRVVRLAGQVFGGYSFIEEYPISTAYRDARVSEIYEGTSEIQRYIIAKELLQKGEMARDAKALEKKQVLGDLDTRLEHVEEVLGSEHPLLDTVKLAEQAKSLADWAFGMVLVDSVVREVVTNGRHSEHNGRGQMVNARLANLATSAMVIDSAVQRSLRVHQEGTPEAKTVGIEGKLAQAFAYEELGRMREEVLGLVNNVSEGKARDAYLAAMAVVDNMTERVLLNVDRLKQEIAKHLTEQGSYTL